jgi:hypothetical protein
MSDTTTANLNCLLRNICQLKKDHKILNNLYAKIYVGSVT